MAEVSTPTFLAFLRSHLNTLLSNTGPALSESRCAWEAESKLDNFIFAAEGASCDAGLLVTKLPEILPTDITGRLFHVLERYRGEEVILPIDFKTLSGTTRHKGSYRHGLHWRPGQQRCAAFVAVNVLAPHLVAVIPTHVVNHKGKNLNRVFRSIQMSRDGIELFPMELAAYVMPVEFLPAALQEIVNFYHFPGNGWRNPFNNIVVRDLPPLSLQKTEVLRPSPSSRIQDLDDEINVWGAFLEHSKDYRLERLMIKPGLGDFQLVSTDAHDKTRVIVEMKKSWCTVDQAGELTHLNRRPVGPHVPGKIYHPGLFSHLASWDYLLSIFGDEEKQQALFVSRDCLPPDWFYHGEEKMSWTPDEDFLKKHLLPWGHENWLAFVRGVERIFSQRKAMGYALQAQRKFENVPLSPHQIQNLLDGERKEEIDEEGGVSLLEITNSNKSPPSAPALQAEAIVSYVAEELVRRQCRKRGFGWLYRLGIHPTASYVYAPIQLDTTRPPTSFWDLDVETPLIYVNFINIHAADELEPEVRHRTQFYHITHGTGSSVCVMFPFDNQFVSHGLDCYIVPSNGIDGDGTIYELLEDNLKKGRYSRKRFFRLGSDEMLTIYRQSETEIASFLEGICRQWSNSPVAGGMPFSAPGKYGSGYIGDVVNSKREVIQRGLDMEFGRTLWSHIITTVPRFRTPDESE